MPVPIGHWQNEPGPRRLSRRERRLSAGVSGVLALVVIAVLISFTSHQRKSHNGCIDVSAATVIGGSDLYRCGATARGLCTSATGDGAQDVAFRRALADACRKAGLPVPRVPAGA